MSRDAYIEDMDLLNETGSTENAPQYPGLPEFPLPPMYLNQQVQSPSASSTGHAEIPRLVVDPSGR